MTDYSEETDDQINYRVGGAMGIEQSYQVPDYCNDWAAIGPIIEKYEINPKRAAAICFLMMQDAKG
jgi:hypothetical protein